MTASGAHIPFWVRMTHWINACAALLMITSGWRIYDANPFMGFKIPPYITLGGWLGGALQWHFAAMWLLAANGLFYLACSLTTGRIKNKFFPISPRSVLSDLVAAIRGRLSHDDLSKYNAVQKAAYLFAIADLIVLVLSGLVLWKSVQFPHLRELMAGYEGARRVHFFAMSGLVGFIIVHVGMALLVPRSLLAMLRGAAMIVKPPRPKLDKSYIIKAAEREIDPSRRHFLGKSLTLGGLTLLTGCTLGDEFSVEAMLRKISMWNDRAQAALFDPTRLAPTYDESMLTTPFPFNAFYTVDKAPVVDPETYELDIDGLVDDSGSWPLRDLYALPRTEQITRHICVEGWSAIGRWGGVTFSDFLTRIGADKTARYIRFDCADGYYTSIDMPTALHPQTLLTFTYDGQILPRAYGFPMKLRMPTKLGYKNPKYIMSMTVTNDYPGGYWEDQGYNWFGGS